MYNTNVSVCPQTIFNKKKRLYCTYVYRALNTLRNLLLLR